MARDLVRRNYKVYTTNDDMLTPPEVVVGG